MPFDDLLIFPKNKTIKQYRESWGIHICGIVYHKRGIVYHICGTLFTTYVVYYTTFVVYKKYFFLDFGNKNHAQNSRIAYIFRI